MFRCSALTSGARAHFGYSACVVACGCVICSMLLKQHLSWYVFAGHILELYSTGFFLSVCAYSHARPLCVSLNSCFSCTNASGSAAMPCCNLYWFICFILHGPIHASWKEISLAWFERYCSYACGAIFESIAERVLHQSVAVCSFQFCCLACVLLISFTALQQALELCLHAQTHRHTEKYVAINLISLQSRHMCKHKRIVNYVHLHACTFSV